VGEERGQLWLGSARPAPPIELQPSHRQRWASCSASFQITRVAFSIGMDSLDLSTSAEVDRSVIACGLAFGTDATPEMIVGTDFRTCKLSAVSSSTWQVGHVVAIVLTCETSQRIATSVDIKHSCGRCVELVS
jgi:hypothetical protein